MSPSGNEGTGGTATVGRTALAGCDFSHVVMVGERSLLGGGYLSALILLISLALGIIPIAGIVWMIVSGSILNVDGLFMSLILLTFAGIFFLNSALELR